MCLLWILSILILTVSCAGADFPVLMSMGLQNYGRFRNESERTERDHSKRPNILLILADDLGFGDTSVAPFVGNGALTPNLEAMAARGTVMTNFHTAATVCTPTRASILTGMNPWRLGVRSVFEYGLDTSDRNNWLPQVPTVASAFRDANYTAKHSGKWHVGGMRNDDLDMRMLQGSSNTHLPGSRRCPHPGPNQQGFDEYVSVLDGPGAPRQNELQLEKRLYSRGCLHLLKNDVSIGKEEGERPKTYPNTETLSQCEARHAIRQMAESVKEGKPFYQHLWFHAPHGPWEYLDTPEVREAYADRNDRKKMDADSLVPCNIKDKSHRWCSIDPSGGKKKIVDRGPQLKDKYQSMITDMDAALGKVLRALKELGVERDTMVVFTSDNGPEEDAGCTELWKLPPSENPWKGQWSNWNKLWTTVGLRGNKRFVYQGGLHVPAIVQWVGTVPRGRNCSAFTVSTDLMPTFLEAAKVDVPNNARLDGMSFLSEIVPERVHRAITATAPTTEQEQEQEQALRRLSVGGAASKDQDSAHISRRDHKHRLRDRVVFWHNDFEGPRATAARLLDFKLILDGKERPFEMFDLRRDPRETTNLIKGREQAVAISAAAMAGAAAAKDSTGPGAGAAAAAAAAHDENKESAFTSANILGNVNGVRSNPALHKWLFSRMYTAMRDYADHGNAADVIYRARNHGRNYNATVESNMRRLGNRYKGMTKGDAQQLHKATIDQGYCATECPCETLGARDVPAFPVDEVEPSLQYIMPKHPEGFVDANALLRQ